MKKMTLLLLFITIAFVTQAHAKNSSAWNLSAVVNGATAGWQGPLEQKTLLTPLAIQEKDYCLRAFVQSALPKSYELTLEIGTYDEPADPLNPLVTPERRCILRGAYTASCKHSPCVLKDQTVTLSPQTAQASPGWRHLSPAASSLRFTKVILSVP